MRKRFSREDAAVMALRIAAVRIATAEGRPAALVQRELLREAVSQMSLAKPEETRRLIDVLKRKLPEVNDVRG